MSPSNLVPLLQSDGSWPRFLDDWRRQCDTYGEEFEGYASGSMQVLDELAKNPEPRTGVYALEREGRFDAVCQANVASIPGYESPVLRIRMMVVAPEYDLGDHPLEAYSGLLIDLFTGVITLSFEGMPARHIKFHLRSPADRPFFAAFGAHLGTEGAAVFEAVQVRGGWLYVTKR